MTPKMKLAKINKPCLPICFVCTFYIILSKKASRHPFKGLAKNHPNATYHLAPPLCQSSDLFGIAARPTAAISLFRGFPRHFLGERGWYMFSFFWGRQIIDFHRPSIGVRGLIMWIAQTSMQEYNYLIFFLFWLICKLAPFTHHLFSQWNCKWTATVGLADVNYASFLPRIFCIIYFWILWFRFNHFTFWLNLTLWKVLLR